MRLIDIARVVHEANRAYCDVTGDNSQVPWDDALDNIKASAIDGVRFTALNPDAGDSAQHENWLRFKAADGWVYGEKKDAEAKTHPCMVPFAELPLHQQAKDAMFRGIVLALRPLLTDLTQAG